MVVQLLICQSQIIDRTLTENSKQEGSPQRCVTLPDFQYSLLGDSAIGEGVTRHVLSTVMEQLQNGFLLDEEEGIS